MFPTRKQIRNNVLLTPKLLKVTHTRVEVSVIDAYLQYVGVSIIFVRLQKTKRLDIMASVSFPTIMR